MRAVLGPFGVVLRLHFLRLSFGIVRNHELHRVDDGAHAEGACIEVLACGRLEHGVVVERVEARVADHVHKLADRLRTVAAAAESAERRHARVVPAVHASLLHECQQLALRHHRVGQFQAVELELPGAVVVQVMSFLQLVDEVVVERAVGHKFKGADRVRHPLEEVTLAVCEVVHWVHLPLAARAVVLLVDNAVDDGVAEVHVRVRHVDFCAQHHRALGQFARIHFFEQRQALLYGAVAVGARRARPCGRALLLGDLLARLFVHVSLALANEAYGEVPKLVEVVRGVVDVAPLEAQPLDVVLDGFHILRVLLLRVRVVEAEVAHAAELLSHAEVHADGLGMANVEVAVRFGREARLEAASVLAFFKVRNDDLFYKVERFLLAVFVGR